MRTNRILYRHLQQTIWIAFVGSAVLSLLVTRGWTAAQEPAATTAASAVAPNVKVIPEGERQPVAIATTKVSTGQRIVTTTHSFNVYVLQEPDDAPGTSPLASWPGRPESTGRRSWRYR